MSHVTDIKLRIQDLDALEEAADKCGFELQRDKKTFEWFGRFMGDSNQYGGHKPEDFGKCEHALRLKGAPSSQYEIGVVKALDGNGFELLADTWGSGQNLVKAAGGVEFNKLRREYAAAVATRKAQALVRKGFRLTREDLAGGRIKLKLRKA